MSSIGNSHPDAFIFGLGFGKLYWIPDLLDCSSRWNGNIHDHPPFFCKGPVEHLFQGQDRAGLHNEYHNISKYRKRKY